MRRTRKLTSCIVGLGSGFLLTGCAPEPVEHLAETNQALSQGLAYEIEPNDTSATATPIGSDTVVRAKIFQATTDTDYFAFQGTAGEKIHAATATSFSPSSSDTTLALFQPDGTTLIEQDLDDGSLSGTSSSIAGATLTQTGTHYLRVVQAAGSSTIRPYDLHFKKQTSAPVPEVEPNDMAPNTLPASGFVTGALSSPTDIDPYLITLNAGDTIFASLDLDPLRDNTPWNGQLLIAAFGPGNTSLVVNDGSVAALNSEAFPLTVKNAGTYGIIVNAPAGVVTVGDYNLSVSVHPATAATANCTTYTSADIPKTIPTGPGVVSSTIVIPGNPRIADIDVTLDLNHTLPQDLDITLTSPAGNTNALVTDVGGPAGTTFIDWNVTLDDEAAFPPLFQVLNGLQLQPESAYRLDWFDGENAGGTWTLNLNDDTALNGGTLNGWSVTICEPPAAPTCAGGAALQPVLNTDFESGAAGFTHSGTLDEWALGTPTFVPVAGCNSGTNCWKTDLVNTYEASCTQNLVSPPISLANKAAPVQLQWAMKYQMESASFDHAWVEVREVGGANARRVWEFTAATMSTTVGTATIQESAGWGVYTADVSAYAGKQIELVFHLDSDASGQFAGLAIDDVSVSACNMVVCGDGVVSAGEACDDGNTAAGDCCSPSCQFEASTTVCRAATGVCDAVEMCTGSTGTCPADVQSPMGTVCRPAVDACDAAETCTGSANTCPADTKMPDGTACSDSNACTQMDTCQVGACVAGTPIVCAALDQCHVVGTCDTTTGMCSNPNAADGASCNDGNACTTMDSCQVGACVGANPVMCAALDQCHVAGTCDTATGMCSNPNAADGASCNDGNACTTMDSCQVGACVGANPVMCAALDQCHVAGTCDTATGMCNNPNAADGVSCNDGNACTKMDSCQVGACVGANPVMCAALDQCHVVGTCDTTTGMCSNPTSPDGVTCDDGDKCTTMDSCTTGLCVGTLVTCTADECHDVGACDSINGMCNNPAKPDGTACSNGGTCKSGTCTTGTGGAGGTGGTGGAGGAGGGGAGGAGGAGGGGMGGSTSASSSSSSGVGGVGGEGGGGGGAAGKVAIEGGGCACTTVGNNESTKSSFFALFGLFGMLAAKLRRRK